MLSKHLSNKASVSPWNLGFVMVSLWETQHYHRNMGSWSPLLCHVYLSGLYIPLLDMLPIKEFVKKIKMHAASKQNMILPFSVPCLSFHWMSLSPHQQHFPTCHQLYQSCWNFRNLRNLSMLWRKTEIVSLNKKADYSISFYGHPKPFRDNLNLGILIVRYLDPCNHAEHTATSSCSLTSTWSWEPQINIVRLKSPCQYEM